MAAWLEQYGLWVVLLGGILEGETVFVAAGFALSQGFLPLLPTLAVAALAGSLGDHFYYAVGRRWGTRVLRWIPGGRRLHAHAILLLRRWGPVTAFAMRFAYGLRMVLPASLGALRFRLSLFTPLNALGSLAFAALYLSLGYLFGEAAEEYLGRLRGRELRLLSWLLGAGVLFWGLREWWLLRLARRSPPLDDEPQDRG